MYLKLFEGLLLVGALFVFASQLVLPALRGTALFPWFRRERQLRGKVAEVNQQAREGDLEDELARATEPVVQPTAGGDEPASTANTKTRGQQ